MRQMPPSAMVRGGVQRGEEREAGGAGEVHSKCSGIQKMDRSHQMVKTQGLFIDCIDPVTIQHPPLCLFISCLVSGTYLSSLSSCVVCLHAKCHFL